MAYSIESQSEESTDKSLGVMDCGASITITGSQGCPREQARMPRGAAEAWVTWITGSLLNCVDVEEHKTIIEIAKVGESTMATNVCSKTYFVKNRVGDMVSITTSAIYVKGFVQDVIAGI
jgi:hypothetical protein